MTAYLVFETVVITATVGLSLNHLVQRYLPAVHLSLRNGIATRLGWRAISAPLRADGCDSGCGSCATGCGSAAQGSGASVPREQPLSFHPRKP